MGPWFISVEDGFAKVKDEGCGIGSRTGIYRLESWTDYEVKTRIQLRSLGSGGLGVELLVRVAPPRIFDFSGNSYRIWFGDPLNIEEWYDVRIVSEGNRVTFFLDGRKVNEQAAVRMSGGVAFVAEMSGFNKSIQLKFIFLEISKVTPNVKDIDVEMSPGNQIIMKIPASVIDDPSNVSTKTRIMEWKENERNHKAADVLKVKLEESAFYQSLMN